MQSYQRSAARPTYEFKVGRDLPQDESNLRRRNQFIPSRCIRRIDVSSIPLCPLYTPRLGISIVHDIVDVTLPIILASLLLSQCVSYVRQEKRSYHCVLLTPHNFVPEQPPPLRSGKETLATGYEFSPIACHLLQYATRFVDLLTLQAECDTPSDALLCI